MGSSLMLQIVNGKGKKGKREENKKKEKSLPPIYRSFAGMACQNIPRKASGKMTHPGFEWHGGFGRDPLQTGIYFPPLWMCQGGQRPGAGQEMAGE